MTFSHDLGNYIIINAIKKFSIENCIGKIDSDKIHESQILQEKFCLLLNDYNYNIVFALFYTIYIFLSLNNLSKYNAINFGLIIKF